MQPHKKKKQKTKRRVVVIYNIKYSPVSTEMERLCCCGVHTAVLLQFWE